MIVLFMIVILYYKRIVMKKDKLTPRNDRKKVNRSISPCNAASKTRLKNGFFNHKLADKENDPMNSKDEASMKICLDLANYHKKQSEMLKKKNELLEQRFNEQVSDMQNLKSELSKIKSTVLNSHNMKKEFELMKSEKNNLKKQNQLLHIEVKTLKATIEELNQENLSLKNKGKEADSVYIESASKCDIDIKPLTFEKESRRKQLVSKYEGINFAPSIACLECKRKENELEDARNIYSKQLMELQRQVASLQKGQITCENLERQLISKTECIDYLLTQLDILETDSGLILRNMSHLQLKMKDIEDQNKHLRREYQSLEQYSCDFSSSLQ